MKNSNKEKNWCSIYFLSITQNNDFIVHVKEKREVEGRREKEILRKKKKEKEKEKDLKGKREVFLVLLSTQGTGLI